MPRQRSGFRNTIEFLAVRIALASLSRTPLPIATRLGRTYSGLLDGFVPRFRKIARENLTASLPDLTETGCEEIVDGVFRSIGRILVAFARFPNIRRDNVDSWIRMEGLEHVQNALARGRGLIFATAHLGNWELSAFAFAMLFQPIYVVVRPLDNPLIDEFAERYRCRSGNRLIGKRDYVRGILEALRRNEMVGILADQHDQSGILIDFFGRPASASPGIARIASKTGAAVVPGFAIWSEEERKYILRFLPEVQISGRTQEDTQNIQAAVEGMIRRYPDQWLWIHRRWKLPTT